MPTHSDSQTLWSAILREEAESSENAQDLYLQKREKTSLTPEQPCVEDVGKYFSEIFGEVLSEDNNPIVDSIEAFFDG